MGVQEEGESRPFEAQVVAWRGRLPPLQSVRWRDAELDEGHYYMAAVDPARLAREQRQQREGLQADVDLVARCNGDGELMADADIRRLESMGRTVWQRYLTTVSAHPVRHGALTDEDCCKMNDPVVQPIILRSGSLATVATVADVLRNHHNDAPLLCIFLQAACRRTMPSAF